MRSATLGLGISPSRFCQLVLRVLCKYVAHQKQVTFEGCAACPVQLFSSKLLGSTQHAALFWVIFQVNLELSIAVRVALTGVGVANDVHHL